MGAMGLGEAGIINGLSKMGWESIPLKFVPLLRWADGEDGTHEQPPIVIRSCNKRLKDEWFGS